MTGVRSWLLPFLFLYASIGTAATPPDTLLARATAIDGYIARLGKLGFSGVFVLEADGKLLVERGCGLADRERKTPWSTAIVSDIGSITKQFTAAAILHLQEQGKLHVEDSLAKYIDTVPPDKTGITLHHLLTHSSGIVDVPDKDDWDPVGRDDIVHLTMAAPLATPPGEHYEYSNAGFSLLGVVIEKLTGKSYEAFLREVLFEPAGMTDTGYVLPKWDPGRIAVGYRDGARWGTTLERPFASDGPYWILRANGGIHSTAPDMLRWAHTLMDNRVLTEASRRALWTKHVDESNGNGDSWYGYAWSIEDLPDGRTFATHNGGNGIHFAHYAVEPSERLVLFVMTNVAAEFSSVLLLQDIGGHLFSGKPLPHVPDVQPLAAEFSSRVKGDYSLERAEDGFIKTGLGYTVRVEGDALAIDTKSFRDFARLYGAAPSDLDRLEAQSRTVDECMVALLRGDYEPMHAAYEARVPLDVLRERGEARLRDDASRYGKLLGHTTLGSLLANDGSITFVQFRHERGTHYRRYIWSADGKLRGMSASRRDVPPRFYHDGGQRFVSFEVGVPASRIAFVAHENGSVSAKFGPDAAYALRRSNRSQ